MSDTLSDISAYSILIPIVVGLLYFRQFDKNAMIMFLLILLAGIPQLFSAVLHDPRYDAFRIALYNVYSLADPLVWALLFFRNIRNEKLKKLVAAIPVVQISLWVYLLIARGIQTSLFIEMICLTSVIQVLWIAVFFYEQYSSNDVSRIETKPLFWFCLGVLIYAPTSYFLFVFYEQRDSIWIIHSVVNILMYCVISVGFWVNKKNEFNFS